MIVGAHTSGTQLKQCLIYYCSASVRGGQYAYDGGIWNGASLPPLKSLMIQRFYYMFTYVKKREGIGILWFIQHYGPYGKPRYDLIFNRIDPVKDDSVVLIKVRVAYWV